MNKLEFLQPLYDLATCSSVNIKILKSVILKATNLKVNSSMFYVLLVKIFSKKSIPVKRERKKVEGVLHTILAD